MRRKPPRPMPAREAAQIGPRTMKHPASVEFAWQTLALLKTFWESKRVTEQHWAELLAEADRHRIYDRIPPGQPFGSLAAMIRAEIGVSPEEATETIRLRAHGGARRGPGLQADNISLKQYGTGESYLRARLERDHQDTYFAALNRGEYPSVRAAAIAAGIIKVPDALEVCMKAYGKLDAGQRRRFRTWLERNP